MSDSIIIEVRSATGGDEAKIWADDLLRMYLKFAEKKGFKAIVSGQNIKVKGENAFNILKNETGVHRVQRVPKTEKYGRVHTSTATVAVLPENLSFEVSVNPADLEWQFYRASSQGGQNVQKVSSAVRLIHKPTNTVVTSEQERTQVQNRAIALGLLKEKLQIAQTKRQKEVDQEMRSGIGMGRRSEKIRTYNFPQNRVTDHRINKSFHNLEQIMNGNLDKIIKKFI
jgi:peptide chain release factor 1